MAECSKVIYAFVKGESKRIKNDDTNGIELRYHNNRIAYRIGNEIRFTLCGWNTRTTRLRLNLLLDALGVTGGFSQMKHKPYLGSAAISSKEWFTWKFGLTTANEIVTYNMMTQWEAA